MKYSISADQPKTTPVPQAQLSRAFSNYQETYAFWQLENNRIQLMHMAIQKEQSNPDSKSSQIIEDFTIQSDIDWQRLKHITINEDEWILFLQRPFQIIFCLRKYKTAIPIILQQQLDLEQMSCYVTYPDVTIYAYSTTQNNNLMYNINLQTFQIRQISTAKEYSPGKRTNFWTHFSDLRLYVMGGKDKNNANIDKLLWTYNMENNYWFALQTNETVGRSRNCQFENGKVLAITDDEMYVVQLYQSRVAKLQSWREVCAEQDLKSIRGVYLYQDWLYLLGSKEFPRFRIAKIKPVAN